MAEVIGLLQILPPFLKGSDANEEPDASVLSYRGRGADTATWTVTSSVPPHCSVCKAQLPAHGEYEEPGLDGECEFVPAGCTPCELHPDARVIWPDRLIVEADADEDLIRVDYQDRPAGDLRTGASFRPDDAALLVIALSKAQAWLAHRRAHRAALAAIGKEQAHG